MRGGGVKVCKVVPHNFILGGRAGGGGGGGGVWPGAGLGGGGRGRVVVWGRAEGSLKKS